MVFYGDDAPQLAGSVIALAALAVITFALRVYTRIRSRSFGVDDWTMTIAMVSLNATLRRSARILTTQLPFLALTTSCIGGAYNGIGVHQFRLSEEQTKTGMQVLRSSSYTDRS